MIFYSANIFQQIGQSGPMGAAFVSTANFLGAVIGMVLLTKIGRKPLMLSTMVLMTACMIGMGIVYNLSG